jgi:hypothetical protein
MIYTSNPSTGRLSREDHKFKASVGYIVRLYLKIPEKKKSKEKDKQKKKNQLKILYQGKFWFKHK